MSRRIPETVGAAAPAGLGSCGQWYEEVNGHCQLGVTHGQILSPNRHHRQADKALCSPIPLGFSRLLAIELAALCDVFTIRAAYKFPLILELLRRYVPLWSRSMMLLDGCREAVTH